MISSPTRPGAWPRRAVAVNVGKGARWLSRRLDRGGGTALPGLLAEKIDPSIVAALASSIPNGCIFITGTNGKTTTTRILGDALRRSGLFPLSNREGSNLLQGLGSTLLSYADVWGNLKVPENAIGLFEVDEGALLPVVEAVRPRLVIITNLFRDQLDRYFEVDYLAHLWARSLSLLPPSTQLALNADDPQVAALGDGVANPVLYFGVEDVEHAQSAIEHASDSIRCLRCGADFLYRLTFYAHLGHYVCPSCGWRRPDPRVAAWKIGLMGLEGSHVEAVTPWGGQGLRVPLAGLHNVYNSLAAAAGAFSLGVDPASVEAAVAYAAPAFGRFERFSVDGRNVCLTLVKNPSGFNAALRVIFHDEHPKRLLFALNDHIPDGRDVSWIWDVDLERCRPAVRSVVASGRRAYDLAVRLKYAGLFPGGGDAAGSDTCRPELIVEPDVVTAFWKGLERTPPGDTLYVLPTYTAMWALREQLARDGHLERFWRQ